MIGICLQILLMKTTRETIWTVNMTTWRKLVNSVVNTVMFHDVQIVRCQSLLIHYLFISLLINTLTNTSLIDFSNNLHNK